MTILKTFPTSSLSFLADSSFHKWANEPRRLEIHQKEEPFDVFKGDLKEAGYLLRTGEHRKLALFFADLGISRSPHPLWQFATGYHHWIAPLNENMVWRTLGFWAEKLTAALIDSGYVTDGFLRRIRSAEDGVTLVTIICKNLPPDWDFLDALSYLHEHFKTDSRYEEHKFDFYNIWDPEGMKSINATFRSWAIYETRYEGEIEERKLQALLHPLGNRFVQVQIPYDLQLQHHRWLEEASAAEELISKAARLEKRVTAHLIQNKDQLLRILPRLRVEIFALDWHLNLNPEWFRRLFPQKTPEDLCDKQKEYRMKIEEAKEVIRHISEELSSLPS